MRARVGVYFMPETNLEDLLTNHILRAKKSIHIAMYCFTHPDITRALSIAQDKHHVEVKIVLDAQVGNDVSEVDASVLGFLDVLLEEGIPVKISTGWGKMHHKNCVIDSSIVLVGSANYSKVVEGSEDDSAINGITKTLSLSAQKRWGGYLRSVFLSFGRKVFSRHEEPKMGFQKSAYEGRKGKIYTY